MIIKDFGTKRIGLIIDKYYLRLANKRQDENLELPTASAMKEIIITEDEFVNMVRADINDGRIVKRSKKAALPY